MRFNFFKNLGFFSTDDKELSEEAQKQLFFSEKFDKFYDLNDYIFCLDLINQGYKSSEIQQEKLLKKIEEKIENNELKFIELKKYQFIPNNLRVKSFINYQYGYSENETNKSDLRDLLNEDKAKAFKQVVSSALIEYFNLYASGLNSYKYFCQYDVVNLNKKKTFLNKSLNNSVLLSQNIKNEEDTKCISHIVKTLETILIDIERLTSSSYRDNSYKKIGYEELKLFQQKIRESLLTSKSHEEEKEDILNKLKSFNLNFAKIEIKQEFSINDLPKNAQAKIKEIEKIVNILDNKDQSLFSEHLNNIIKKYLSIDVEYRMTLKNVEGYNAEQLMEQSLDNLKTIFEKNIVENNQQSLTELSIEHRKLKMM